VSRPSNLALYFEMQELWLQTRIRRDDYWFLGDLRRLDPNPYGR